jgi:ecotin
MTTNFNTTNFLIAVMLELAIVSLAQAADELKVFPPADNGMVRYVLQPPKQKDESLFKVELIVGKTVTIDKENKYFFTGKIEAEPIAGLGYTRYTVSELGPMAGTLMAVDPEAPKVDQFIALGGEPYLINYNSRLPVVVYVPDSAEVRYRIWTTTSEKKTMVKN